MKPGVVLGETAELTARSLDFTILVWGFFLL
jgi:hypothetical protein